VFNEHTDDDGATVFRHACKLGLEGDRVEASLKPIRSGHWLKASGRELVALSPPD